MWAFLQDSCFCLNNNEPSRNRSSLTRYRSGEFCNHPFLCWTCFKNGVSGFFCTYSGWPGLPATRNWQIDRQTHTHRERERARERETLVWPLYNRERTQLCSRSWWIELPFFTNQTTKHSSNVLNGRNKRNTAQLPGFKRLSRCSADSGWCVWTPLQSAFSSTVCASASHLCLVLSQKQSHFQNVIDSLIQVLKISFLLQRLRSWSPHQTAKTFTLFHYILNLFLLFRASIDLPRMSWVFFPWFIALRGTTGSEIQRILAQLCSSQFAPVTTQVMDSRMKQPRIKHFIQSRLDFLSTRKDLIHQFKATYPTQLIIRLNFSWSSLPLQWRCKVQKIRRYLLQTCCYWASELPVNAALRSLTKQLSGGSGP